MDVSSKAPRILFVNDEPSDQITTFIRQDLLLLKERFSVEYLSLHTYKHAHLDAILSPSVWKAVARNDLVFAWFGWNAPVAIAASILGKPSVIVAGGADVVSVPEIGYGLSRRNIWRLYLKTLGFRLAKRVLLFSESSRRDWLTLPGMQPQKAQTLYLGVDSDSFRPEGIKKAQALTIGYINENNLRRKGFQTFVEAAQLAPDVPFRLGGKIEHVSAVEKIRSMASSNVSFLGPLDDAQLLAEYQSTQVYAQLSLHEGFGMALAEAMSCACVPVVTDRGAIPEVVGDTGLYVPVDDPLAASEAIRETMLSQNDTRGQRARQRIIELFPMSKRKAGLELVMETVISS